ncbi:MAG TPA: DUF72 domain-containing protein [Sphingomonas sp.]|nr:DUF72 domain-containing protein [Sphingomonas sp.]
MNRGTIRVGVGGWDYDPWRETFYPPGTSKAKQLAYAGTKLTAIEINGTYYGRQKPETFAKWAEAVPDGFKFAVKASRFCTNRRVLAEGAESIERFLSQGLTELGDRLGPILWQFMATKKFDADDFRGFLDLLPIKQDGVPLQHAIEVRHESFQAPEFAAMVNKAGHAVVFAHSNEFPEITAPSSSLFYARLQESVDAAPTGYDDKALNAWATRAKGWAANGRDAFVFFISGAKHRNPAAAMALIEKLA